MLLDQHVVDGAFDVDFDFVDTMDARQATSYGVIEADPSPQTLLTVGAIYADVKGVGLFNYGLPRALDGSDLRLSRSWSIDPPWTTTDANGYQVFTGLEHRFDNGWNIKLSLQRDDATADTKRVIMRGAIEPTTGRGNTMAPSYWIDDDTDFEAADLILSGTQTWWGREHHILLGVNWNENLRKGLTVSPPKSASKASSTTAC